MSFDVMNACADMILTNAIEDMALEDNISDEEIRSKILKSKAYDCLYDFDTGLWMEGSDYFIDFYRKVKEAG